MSFSPTFTSYYKNTESINIPTSCLNDSLQSVNKIITIANKIRQKMKYGNRQPLLSVSIKSKDIILRTGIRVWFKDILDELNVREVILYDYDVNNEEYEYWSKNDVKDIQDNIIGLDSRIPEYLKIEGIFNNLSREIQNFRKKNNLEIKDRINIKIIELTNEYKQACDTHLKELLDNCGIYQITKNSDLTPNLEFKCNRLYIEKVQI